MAAPLRDRLSFLSRLPVLLRGTADDDTPCPGYLFEEIAKISHESPGSSQCLLEHLLTRLQSSSCHVKLKVLKILLHTCSQGSPQFVLQLKRNASFIREATVFSGPPDPLHGNSLNQKVRAAAQDLASILFSDAPLPQPLALPARPPAPAGMGSSPSPCGSLQGFGFSSDRNSPASTGEALLSSLQRAAEAVAQAVLPAPGRPQRLRGDLPEDTYEPVRAPSPASSPAVPPPTPPAPRGSRVSHQPGLAGGGWEEADSGHSSRESSQGNERSRTSDSGSKSGSDSRSGASRELSHGAESRVDADSPGDCRRELSLVSGLTRGARVFLTREESQHFLKETPFSCSNMKSTRSCCSVQSSDVADLILTGLPAPVSRRPGSASPAKLVARSVSVAADGKAKRNAPENAGSRAMNNLRRSNSTTQVNQRVNSSHSLEQTADFLAFFEGDPGGRRKLAALSKTSPEKKTTWNILDDQPRAFPGPSGSHSLEPPMGMRRKEATVLLAANFTANNRSNKGAMGNCVTTMVHNNYSTAEKGPAPKSSNQAPSSLNNVVKATSNEDGEGSSSFVKSQKNFSSNNIMTHNNNSSSSSSRSVPQRREVTEEEAERFIQQVNLAAVTIQRWYRRHSQRHRTAAAALGRLMAAKREERQRRMEEGNILDLQEKKDEERRKIREEKARLARHAAIQELQQKRAQKASEAKHSPEELVLVKESRRVPKKKLGAKHASARNVSPAGSLTKANNAAGEPEGSSLGALDSVPSQDPRAEEKLQDASSKEMGNEDPETAVTAGSRAPSKVTLNELLDTLRLLEEEPELLPPPKLLKKDKYAWMDRQEPSSNSLTADNLEKFGKLNHPPGVPEDGALLSEAKLQSIINFLDEMEKSEQERPRSAASATQREGFLLEEELAHVEQVSAVATEVTSSMMRLKLEVEEKKRAISLLQTALTQQRELTDRHIKQTEKELGHQLRLQREQYEAAIQRHLAFIDQLLSDKKVLSEKCEAVVAELKQVDQKYGQKITQMQEQHELVWRTLGPFCEEIKKLKELMSATEKIRREKWIEEKTKKIKEITVKGLEPEIQKLLAKHREDIRQLKLLHEAELLQSDERAAQHYERQAQELRGLLEREREEQSQRERERARQRCEQQLEQEEQALELQRRRLYAEVAEEKERLSQQAARQRAEAEELQRQLEANSSALTRALRDKYTKEKEEQERQHQAELKVLKDQLELEKQAWEANYVKKEEAWLLSRERELREEMRKERDKEIELVIQRLEADTSLAKEECERAAENRIKRIRDKYEVELQELERSERKLQERCNELKGRLAELEGESSRLQGLLKHKEQEVEEIRKEFADRLVGTEEENTRLKAEMAELRARQHLELDRLVQEKNRELEEVHRRQLCREPTSWNACWSSSGSWPWSDRPARQGAGLGLCSGSPLPLVLHSLVPVLWPCWDTW
ncbi:centrosomal protein of 131 kDa isoform X3 [Cinclus cinclus]|uniref:centrosomal protein of 131 kDa isoform X3 n=1 Tax=Cinclus cinclus TaxID=127875 RepID=UPI002E0FD3FE